MKEKKKIISSLPPSAKVHWSQSCCCMLQFGFLIKNWKFDWKTITSIHPPVHKPSHSHTHFILLTNAFKNREARKNNNFSFKENRSIAFWGYENFINLFFEMEAFRIYKKRRTWNRCRCTFFSLENVIYNVSFLIHENRQKKGWQPT